MYYFILSLPFAIFFSRLFLTNYAVPMFKKRQLRKLIAIRINSESIFEVENFLKILFKNNYSKIVATCYRLLTYHNNREFIYGEIDLLAFHNIIEKAEPQHGEIFYDLDLGLERRFFLRPFILILKFALVLN